MKIYRVFDKKTGLYVGAAWHESEKSNGKIFVDRRTLLNFIQQQHPDFIFEKNKGRFEVEEYAQEENGKIICFDCLRKIDENMKNS